MTDTYDWLNHVDRTTCGCGHDRDQHDPIDFEFAGACGECDCQEYRG